MRLARARYPTDPNAEQQARAELDSIAIDDLVKSAEQNVRNVLLDSQRMLCMAGNRQAIQMWAYYADRHRGVAIHLRPDVWPIAAAMRVSYTKKYPRVALSKGMDKNEITRQFALKKASAWRHEDEYRLLVQDEDDSNFELEWEADTATFPAGVVIGVTVGCFTPSPDVQLIVSHAQAVQPSLPVYRALARRKRFELTFEQIA
jgi:hypothetical protein